MTSNKISAGSYDLNKWLYGGYEKDIITMIAGPPGSGKTNFSILAACSQAKKNKKVIFIDTEGGFSSERVKQIVEGDYEKILNNILLLNPTNFEEQKKIILDLNKKIKNSHASLIIIDGMAMLYRLELGDATQSKESEKIREINGEVAKQMKNLAEISRKQKIPIIITNQVYNSFLSEEEIERGVKKESNIVGGDLFKYWSKCIIELKNENGRKKAILLKHRSLPQKQFNFIIKDKGIFKRGWV
jgi:DNA repair protein RadB